MRTPRSGKFAVLGAFGLALGFGVLFARGDDAIPETVHAGPLDVRLRTDAGRDVHLRMDTAYPTQDMGDRLTTEQREKLATIRAEAPSKFQILSALFPQQIAEYLLREESAPTNNTAPSDDAVQRLVWEVGSEYITQPEPAGLTEGQRRARADFLRESMAALPEQPEPVRHLMEMASRYDDPDFESPAKADTFLVLKDWYSPYRAVGMSIMGDALRIDGRVVTNHLAADAAAAHKNVEAYADDYYRRFTAALGRWRLAQITGNAYAGSIRQFLNDPRLAAFTPEEVSRAYHRVFGRDLRTDLEADSLTARLGHPVTYNELRGTRRE